MLVGAPHERDNKLQFDEESHTYVVDGISYGSVTSWTKQHFGTFDADEVIGKMMASSRWPQSKYHGMEPDAIKASWKDLGDQESSKGTKLHADIENFYNGQEIHNDSVEWGYFQAFLKDHTHLTPYRSEWRVWDEDLRIAGTIDMVFLDPKTGNACIYDWKRSKEIKTQNRFQKALTPELSHMDDCNYSHYTLQLNLYKILLERNYGLKVQEMYLICLHPNHPNYQKWAVPNMETTLKPLLGIGKQKKNKIHS